MNDKPIGSQIHQTANCIDTFIASYLAKEIHSPLTPMECHTLSFFYDKVGEELCAKDLMQYTCLSKATTSITLSSLEKKKLIEVRIDPNDKRKKFIMVTDEGKRMKQDMDKALDEITKIVENGLSLADKETISRLLKKIKDNVSIRNY